MKAARLVKACARAAVLILLWRNGIHPLSAQPSNVAYVLPPTTNCDVRHANESSWNRVLPETNYNGLEAGAHLRTLEYGQATISFGEHSVVRLGPLTAAQIVPPRSFASKCRFDLERGLLSLLHRDAPADLEIQTLAVNAAVKGTDFAMSVDADGQTTIALLDGEVQMSNSQGSITLESGEKGVALPGQKPTKSPLIDAVNFVQWSLYYPGVLDPDELRLDPASPLAASLKAYRNGGLLAAQALYPANFAEGKVNERLYHAALVLSVGQVTNCEAILNGDQNNPMTLGLRYVIAAVKSQTVSNAVPGSSPSQSLGYSYYAQSQHDLEGALQAAQRAVRLSTNFGFGWERVAELQFSFGRIAPAEKALDWSLRLAPNNAQSHALRGFLLAADNRIPAAIMEFDLAIGLDENLANAWLGRGLCRIRRRETGAGFQDLQTAAALEPTRSLLRSYLGKAFSDAGEESRAAKELLLARRLDTNDPTPWLYSALLDYQENRANQAVSDLEQAVDLNTNRQVYRSKLLLDQDEAVASTSLAKIYQDTGMTEVSVAEASRAVDYDYADYSAHLFLADSLNALRDPTRFNLRYETAWFNELLLANLLSPVGARPISQNISEQDYSRLLEQDGLGFDMTTQYRSDRQLQEVASQYGAFGSTSYSLDLTYQHNDGILHPYRTNNSLSDIEWYSQIKQQIGPNDALTIITKYENYHSGDNFQYNNPSYASPYFHYDEYQKPIAVGAWHHEWGPGVHSLILAGRLTDEQNFADLQATIPVLKITDGKPFIYQTFSNYNLANDLDIYTAEFNQLIQGETHNWILGARYQEGDFHTQDRLTGVFDPANFPSPPAAAEIISPFRRVSAYAYHYWKVFPSLLLTFGVTDDEMNYPDNFRFAPINPGEASRRAVSPKMALTWSPQPGLTFRGAFCQALGGASFDESFTLEPTELAGFNQSFRSVISESLIGSVAGPRYQVLGGAMDLKLQSQTFLTLQVQSLESDLHEDVGAYYHLARLTVPPPNFEPGTAPEELRYHEPSVSLAVNRLLGPYVASGVSYSYTRSTLDLSDAFILGLAPYPVEQDQLEAQLHKVSGYLQFALPSGFYARAEAQWYLQFNSGYVPGTSDPPLPESQFTQVNLYAGWRFWHRRGEVTCGVMNVGGRDYSLNPLNVYSELPRSRVWMGRVRINF
jgi:hypothetical protein